MNSSPATNDRVTGPDNNLDHALQRMAEQPEDAQARLDLHAELSRSEVFVMLEAEIVGAAMQPRVFDLSDGRAVLAFDSEMRLAEFAGTAVPYAALPGRILVAMLAEADEPLSLIINPDAEHAGFLTAEALAWLNQALSGPAPQATRAVPQAFLAPSLPAETLALLIPALERQLAGLPGLGRVVLTGARWQDGTHGHVLALSGLPEAAHPPVARAVAEALALSGLDTGSLDVIFPSETVIDSLATQGLAVSPAPFVAPDDQIVTPGANPGLDPDRPPKLK